MAVDQITLPNLLKPCQKPVIIVLLTVLFLTRASIPTASAQDTLLDRINQLPWMPVNNVTLPLSHALIDHLDNAVILIGSNAAHLKQIEGEPPDTSLEAVIWVNGKIEITIRYRPIGYVSLTPLPPLPLDEFLLGLHDHDSADRISGWAPTIQIDIASHLIYWGVRYVHHDSRTFVTGTVLSFSRFGYEQLFLRAWTTDLSTPFPLLTRISSHIRLPQGSEYTEFQSALDYTSGLSLSQVIENCFGLALPSSDAFSPNLITTLRHHVGWILVFLVLGLIRLAKKFRRSPKPK